MATSKRPKNIAIKNRTRLALLFFTLASALFIGADDKKISDLQNQLKKAPTAEKSAILNQIAEGYSQKKDAEKRLAYGKSALKYAGKYKQDEQRLNALANMARAYMVMGENKNAIANANMYLKLAEQRGNKNEIKNSLDLLWEIYAEIPDFAKAIKACERINGICSEMGDMKGLARYTHLMGRFYYELGDVYHASETFKKAMDLYKKTENLESMVQLQVYIAMLTARGGNLDEAWSILLAAEKECLDNHLGEAACRVFHGMGRILVKQKRLDQAVEYFQKGIAMATKIDSGFFRGTIYQELGNLYQEKNDPDRAQACFENALQFDWNTIEFGGETIVDLLLKIAEIQIGRKNQKEAMACAEKALTNALIQKNKIPEIQTRLCISRIHRLKGDYKKSLGELQRSLKIASRIKNTSLVKETYRQMADLYGQWGKTEESRKYLRLAEKT